MKKFLSMLLALVMVLTMASFPAFAADAEKLILDASMVSIEGGTIYDAKANSLQSNDPHVLFDGDTTKNKTNNGNTDEKESGVVSFKKIAEGGEPVIVLDLGMKYDLSTFSIWWGLEDGYWWGGVATAYTIEVSADGVTYTPAYTGTGLSSGRTRNDLDKALTDATAVQFVKIHVTEAKGNGGGAAYLAIRELELTGSMAITEDSVIAPYTVYYVDAEGNELAPSLTVEDRYVGEKVTVAAEKVVGYKPDADTKTVTLANGENNIYFTYISLEKVSYTINYVDTEGNPIADAKTGEGYEYDVISEDAPNFYAKGYFITGTDLTKKLELALDSDNEITFVYKKIIKVSSFKKTLHNSTDGLWNVSRMYNGEIFTGSYDQLNTSNTTAFPAAEMIFTFDALYSLDKMTTYWGSSNANKVSVYVSKDGVNWGDPVYTGASDDVKTSYANGDTATDAYVAEFDLGGTVGQHIKYVVEDAPKGWLAIREFTFEGEKMLAADLSNATVISQNSWGWTGDPAGTIECPDDVLFDGEDAANKKGYYAYIYAKAEEQPKDYFIEIDLGALYNNPMIAIQGGAPDWNYAHLLAYDVYVAGIDGKYGETPVATIDKGTTITDANKVRTDLIETTGDVRFVKLVVNYALRRPVIGEISVYGEAVNLTTAPEKAGASLGGQIRLPEASLTAGLRFGATIMKGVVGADGIDYDFDTLAAAGAEIGMFMLPADMLGGQTLAQYLAGGGENALKVPAKRILKEDDVSVTFTAVLVDIPESAYDRDIVAVPYLKVGDNYVYYAEMTKNYKGVATAVADSYKAGKTELTDAQIELLEKITGETLVVPVE